MSGNPVATDEQREVERLALRLFERPDVRAAREEARKVLVADPIAQTFEGRMGLERALDQWALALCMREANSDANRPKFAWSVDNSPRQWLGHIYPGAAVAVDNPDNINREAPLDGSGRYEIDIAFGKNPASLSLVVEEEPEDHYLGTFAAALPSLAMKPDAEGKLTVTLDPSPAGDRPHHLQLKPGRLSVFARDSHADWEMEPSAISIRRLDPTGAPPPGEDVIAAEVCRLMVPFVRAWSGFKNTFLDRPEPNRLVGPQGRVGGWGFLAGGRFSLAPGEALAVTVNRAGAAYVGFQIADPWTIAPDPAHATPSRNVAQTTQSPDGTVTFVMAGVDPGLANWIDTGVLSTGWMLLRWQGVPPDADPATFIAGVRHGKVDEVLAALPDLPRIDLAGRRAEIELRVVQHVARTRV